MPHHRLPQHLENPEPIDAGGMGRIYKATWRGDPAVVSPGTPVAVKVPLLPDPELVRRFLTDRKNVLRLSHLNVVRFLDAGGPPEWPEFYFVMEYMPGGSLRDRLDDFRDPRTAVRVVRPLVDALRYLHDERMLVHRDVKPENILFTTDEPPAPKLADFGLTRSVAAEGSSDGARGTPAYAAPELAASSHSVNPAADVYSLGVVLYEILTCRLPGTSDLRPSRHNRAVDGRLDQIVLGCLQKDPSRRYTAAGLARALDSYLKGEFPPRPSIVPATVEKFKRNQIELNVTLLAGGNGYTRYRHPDGVRCTSTADMFVVPDEVWEASEEWLRRKDIENHQKGIPFENRLQPRLAYAGHELTDGAREQQYPLVLQTERTDYFSTQVTHFALDAFLADGQTVRDKYAGRPDELDRSALANPLAINLSVVTSDGYIFTSIRGRRVGGNAQFDTRHRVPAVSGTGHPKTDAGPDGNFDPFKAAVREAREEVLGDYRLRPEEVTFFGVARTTTLFFPFLFGEACVDLTKDRYESERIIDSHDIYGKEGRPFTVEAVTDWIKELYFVYDSVTERLSSGPSHTAIFSLYQSLIYKYHDRIGEINDRLTR